MTETDPATLTASQRGHLAELIFMRKAAALGFSVSKPWQENERYDIILRVGSIFWRVQVKSVLAKQRLRPHYRINTCALGRSGKRRTYCAAEIDFLVAYIFAEDLWYVFPATVIEGHQNMCVSPGSKRSRFEQYREAWKLMKPESLAAAAGSSSS